MDNINKQIDAATVDGTTSEDFDLLLTEYAKQFAAQPAEYKDASKLRFQQIVAKLQQK